MGHVTLFWLSLDGQLLAFFLLQSYSSWLLILTGFPPQSPGAPRRCYCLTRLILPQRDMSRPGLGFTRARSEHRVIRLHGIHLSPASNSSSAASSMWCFTRNLISKLQGGTRAGILNVWRKVKRIGDWASTNSWSVSFLQLLKITRTLVNA